MTTLTMDEASQLIQIISKVFRHHRESKPAGLCQHLTIKPVLPLNLNVFYQVHMISPCFFIILLDKFI